MNKRNLGWLAAGLVLAFGAVAKAAPSWTYFTTPMGVGVLALAIGGVLALAFGYIPGQKPPQQ